MNLRKEIIIKTLHSYILDTIIWHIHPIKSYFQRICAFFYKAFLQLLRYTHYTELSKAQYTIGTPYYPLEFLAYASRSNALFLIFLLSYYIILELI